MNNENDWIFIGNAIEFHEGKKTKRDLNGKPIIILHKSGKWFAFEGRCPHQSRPLDEARINGEVLQCVYHSMSFNMVTGENVDSAGFIGDFTLVVYDVKVDEDGKVWICEKSKPDQLPSDETSHCFRQ